MNDTLADIKELVDLFIEEKKAEEVFGPPGVSWVPYSGPYFDAEEYKAAIETLLTGWLTHGPKCDAFEQKMAAKMGRKYAVMVNSGSSANLLAIWVLVELGILKKGDRVIVPVCSFPTTVNPIIQAGLEPVFVDSELATGNLDLDAVEKILKGDGCFTFMPTNERPIRAICFAHMLGVPPDMDRLEAIAAKYNLAIIEDACDALGGSWKGKPLGSFGDVSTCSCWVAHHLTTIEGGIVATDSKKAYQKLRSLRDWGRACTCQGKGNVIAETACKNRFRKWLAPGGFDGVVDHRYIWDSIGFNLKAIEIGGAIGLEQLKKLPEMEKARRENWEKLDNIFGSYGDCFYTQEPPEGADPCWFGYMVRVNDYFAKCSAADLVQWLEDHKIQTRRAFSGNILYHPAYAAYSKGRDLAKEFPVADTILRDCFFLGVWAGMTDEQIEYIGKTFRQFMKEKTPFGGGE